MPCKPCDAGNLFHIQNLPGTPVGRFVTPLVRINGKVQELPLGMTLPPSALPPEAIDILALVENLSPEDLLLLQTALGIDTNG